ncbi:unnamed protein product [Boreogadus saida]
MEPPFTLRRDDNHKSPKTADYLNINEVEDQRGPRRPKQRSEQVQLPLTADSRPTLRGTSLYLGATGFHDDTCQATGDVLRPGAAH